MFLDEGLEAVGVQLVGDALGVGEGVVGGGVEVLALDVEQLGERDPVRLADEGGGVLDAGHDLLEQAHHLEVARLLEDVREALVRGVDEVDREAAVPHVLVDLRPHVAHLLQRLRVRDLLPQQRLRDVDQAAARARQQPQQQLVVDVVLLRLVVPEHLLPDVRFVLVPEAREVRLVVRFLGMLHVLREERKRVEHAYVFLFAAGPDQVERERVDDQLVVVEDFEVAHRLRLPLECGAFLPVRRELLRDLPLRSQPRFRVRLEEQQRRLFQRHRLEEKFNIIRILWHSE